MICLNAIVRNEAATIERMLESCVGFVDEYVIVDTGSTDNTVEKIQSFHKLKGHVLFHPFQNFGESRNFALTKAKQLTHCDYILFLDADMILHVEHDIPLPLDAATIPQKSEELVYSNVRLVRTTLDVRCVGSTHEYFDIPCTPIPLKQEDIWIEDRGDGGYKQDKYERDLRLLSQDPWNERTVFYLAQTHMCLNNHRQALEIYKMRLSMGGGHAEKEFSILQMVRCSLTLERVQEAEHYKTLGNWHTKDICYEFAKHHRNNGNNIKALQYAIEGLAFTHTFPLLFEDVTIETKLKVEFTLTWYFAFPNDPMPAFKASMDILHLYPDIVISNLLFYSICPPFQCVFQLDGTDKDGFHYSTVETKMKSGHYIVRKVSYTIDSDGRYHGPIVSKHEMVGVGELAVDDTAIRHLHQPSAIIGLEDIRFSEDGRFLASSCEYSDTFVSQVKGRLVDMVLVCEEVLMAPKHEKNHVWRGNEIVTSLDHVLYGLRGSSNFVKHYDLEWCVVHRSIDKDGRRHYLHQLLAFDGWTLKKYSPTFTFNKSPVEFCIHFDVYDVYFEFGVSLNDGCSRVYKLHQHDMPFIIATA